MRKPKKLLFVSTVNLSTNPRILKEIKLAQSLNYHISFLGFQLGNWSDELDRQIRKNCTGPEYIYQDATRKKYLRWLGHSLLERLNRIVWKIYRRNVFLAATACTKRTFSLLDFGRKVKKGDYDLVLGHTIGSLYPVSVIAGKAGCPFSFDVEDYHPGEHIEGDGTDEIKRRELIMRRILPAAKYISASSPLIAKLTRDLCKLDEERVFPILNLFPASEFKSPADHGNGKIKLIWFSQYIGPGRGLEMLLSQWDSLRNNFELTLIGDSTGEVQGILQEGIILIKPLPQYELHALLSEYDIGLALELTKRDINRDVALTNKILAYHQAGLYILATDTASQREFINQHSGSGKLFSQTDHSSLLRSLEYIRENINHIRAGSLKRYQDASSHNWETESEKLAAVWDKILS